jgi:hypothetical protein
MLAKSPAGTVGVPHQHGSFWFTLGCAPSDWPWALPHLYAVNTATDPGDLLMAASASPSGEYEEVSELREDRARLEVVGFWNSEFRVVHRSEPLFGGNVRKQASEAFGDLPVRYLMEAGVSIRENPDVLITGKWPAEWNVRRYTDLGVFCSFLWDRARGRGGAAAAEELKSSISFAWPPTEQVLVYLSALQFAARHLSAWLSKKELRMLKAVTAQAEAWVSA